MTVNTQRRMIQFESESLNMKLKNAKEHTP